MKIDLEELVIILPMVIFMTVPLVIGFLFILIVGSDAAEQKAILALGCEPERFLKQDVCQIGDTYHFVDVDCNTWGFDCTAKIVSVRMTGISGTLFGESPVKVLDAEAIVVEVK